MTTDTSANTDLDQAAGSGRYLSLSKGDKVRLRWIGGLIRFEQWYDGRDGEAGEWARKWALTVLTREGDVGEQIVQGFKFGPMIYTAFQSLWRNKEWGDLSKYDVVIEVPGTGSNYYTVTPCRPTPLTPEESGMVMEAGLDLQAMYFNDKTRLVGSDKKYDEASAQDAAMREDAEDFFGDD